MSIQIISSNAAKSLNKQFKLDDFCCPGYQFNSFNAAA